MIQINGCFKVLKNGTKRIGMAKISIENKIKRQSRDSLFLNFLHATDQVQLM